MRREREWRERERETNNLPGEGGEKGEEAWEGGEGKDGMSE